MLCVLSHIWVLAANTQMDVSILTTYVNTETRKTSKDHEEKLMRGEEDTGDCQWNID